MEIPNNTLIFMIILSLSLIINYVKASPNHEFDKGDSCILKNDEYGTCKEIIDCDYAKDLIRHRKNSEIMSYRCRFRGRKLYVCCPLPAARINDEETNVEATVTKDEDNEVEMHEEQTSSTTETPITTSTTKEEESTTSANKITASSRFQKALCENETPEISLTLDNAENEYADIGEFPFQAAIGYTEETDENNQNLIQYRCGGSLIADDVVISAAHCFQMEQFTPVVVRLGRTSLDDNDEEDYSDGDDVEIEHIKIHPDYSKTQKINDIALIKLKRAVQGSRFPVIKPICLSANDDHLPGNFTVTGFGRNGVDTSKTSNWLLKAIVNEIDSEKCNEIMSNIATITDTQICAMGYKGIDSCQGDSGSPLSYQRDFGGRKLTYLHGIVSYGVSCGSTFPGIYTKVNKYLDWIEKEMNLME